MAFLNDIESKHLSNFVLVTIGTPIPDYNPLVGSCLNTDTGQIVENIGQDWCEISGGVWTQNESSIILHRISTQKITFDGEYYKPILLNIPSISESLDIEQRKYKISSVSLSISDYEEDGERFSDSLNTLMNKEVVIYYASQSCVNLDDCYKAGTYIVRSFSQDEDKVTLNCEDLSQDKLHKDLPLSNLGENDGIPDKYKNKPIPMVFGEVDRTPMLFNSNFLTLIPSDNETDSFVSKPNYPFNDINSPLFFYNNDGYVNFIQGGEEDENPDFASYERQFKIEDNIVILNYNNKKLFPDSTSQLKKSNAYCLDSTKSFKLTIGNSYSDDTDSLSTLDIASEQSITALTDNVYSGNPVDWIINGADFQFYMSPETSQGFEFVYGQIKIHFNPSYNIIEDETVDDSLTLRSFAINGVDLSDYTPSDSQNRSFVHEEDYDALTSINPNTEYAPDNILDFDYGSSTNWSYFIGDTVIDDIISLFSYHDMDLNKIYIDMTESISNPFILKMDSLNVLVFSNFNNTLDIQFRKIIDILNTHPTSQNVDINYNINVEGYFNELDITKITRPTDIFNRDFYAHVIGRQGSAPSSQSIYSEILSELDFDEELIQPSLSGVELGKYAFTIDKKINSKKLIEELSQSTPLYPYFKDGEFRVKSIKKAYSYGDSIPIDVNDVIKYKYDRTKIEKVYTRVNVKYHYDYGLKDFTKETGFVTPIQSGLSDGYSTDYFGEDFDQESVFESKYIRDKTTAFNLAKYLCGLHANQHNIVTLTLPLNYLTLELGDIVRLDDLIQGRKIFGEDYSSVSISDNSYVRNGQNVYKFWFVEQIKKSLDKVEVKLYQLHEFNFEAGVVDIIDEPEEPDIPEEPEEPEEPEIPTLPNVEYCPLPDYEETLLDADGNPVDWTNTEVNWVANPALCINEIIEVPPEPVGYCLIGNSAEYGSTEAECLTSGGEWSASPIVLGCTDDEAVNPNSYATHTDNSQCVYPQELLPPEITSPEEDLVVEIGEVESTEGLGENIVPSNSSTFDENSTESITIEATNPGYNTSFCLTPSNSEYYQMYSNDFFNGGTITNLTTGQTGTILGYFNNPYNNSVRFQSSFSGWNPGDEFIATSLGQNHSTLSASNTNRFLVYGHNGTLRVELTDEGAPQSFYNNGGIRVYNSNNEWLNNILPDTTYRVSVDVRAISHNGTAFRFVGFGSTSPYFSISEAWQTYEYDFIDSNVVNPSLLALSNAGYGDIFEIDNFTIRPVVEVTEPIVTVSWNKSPNLVQTYDELGFTTTGEYLFVIYGIIDNNYTQFYSAEPIQATGQDSYSQVIYLNDTDIPQNTPLSLLITARSTSTYNGNYLFNPTFGFPQPTTIVERSFSWGELDEENIYTVATIVEIIAYLLGEGELTEEQFALADIDGNGIVNITDIVNIIQVILYG